MTNVRLILGYSSIAQLGFITLGIFALDPEARGAQGALLQAVNHGLVVAPLFLIIALLAARAGGSEDLRDMGGIAFRAPVLAALFMIVTLATLAMPGSANFVGEFLILLGVFDSKMAVAIIASTGVVLASVYALRFYIRAMHNRQGPAVTSFEMSLRDALVIVPLVLAIIAFALFPQRAIDAGEPAVQARVAGRDRRGAVTPKAPVIDWEALSPLIALAGGACIVLLVGLLRSGFVRRHVVPALAVRDAGGRRRARRLAVGRQHGGRRARAGDRRPHAVADDGLLRRRHRRGAAVVALARGGRGRRGRVLRPAAQLGRSAWSCWSRPRTWSRCSSASSCSRSRCTCCARRTCGASTSLESGLKYLIVGSVGSATLLYGLAFLYGATGSTDYAGIAEAATSDVLLYTGIALVVAGLAFKASVAPFHQWTPDVYEGAPTAVTGFMAVATKAAAFGVMLRLFDVALIDSAHDVGPGCWPCSR